MTLWNKGTDAADWVTRFTVGEDHVWDTYLLPYDIKGTRVQAWALNHIDILSDDELKAIESALDELDMLVSSGAVVVRQEDEDCHTVIERFLTEKLGETGRRIHTGRSRNDQVLIALRMFLREAGREIGTGARSIIESLCRIGESYDDVMMPGYTHEQRAMPSTPALWAMGYAELLLEDLETLRHATNAVNISPAGTAAGYGVPMLPLPREEMARRAGFRGLQLHVTAAQLSRGKLEMQFVHALVQIAATLNRLATDLVLYNSEEFGFVRLPDEMCTGSSIMPQKKNPDVFELARAAYHRIGAEMQLLQTLPSNLPSGYHRDLQLTKEAVMRATLRSADLVTAMEQGIAGVHFDRDRLRSSLTSDLFATAEALRRVREGTPFRDAYREAAESLSNLQVPADADALADYLADGYPGRCRPDIVSRRLDDFADWLDS